MPDLSLKLLGPFQASLNRRPLTHFRSNKEKALLVYLVTEPPVIHRRETLMTLLWPDLPLESAQTNLRTTIYRLRHNVPEVTSRDGENKVTLLLGERQTLQVNPTAAYETDVAAFTTLIRASQRHQHNNLLTCHACQTRLEEAVALYRGAFLADFYLPDSNEFEEWAEQNRQSFRRQALDASQSLAEIALRQGNYSQAQAHAQRQLTIDNLEERAYRQLMEAFARNGQRNEALAVYEQYRRLLSEELGMTPMTQTTTLFERIRADDWEVTLPAAPAVRGYQLLEEIGAGAFGVVHRAQQPVVGREVAIKIIHPRYANAPDFIRRFETEAQTIARLEHPHIVPLYDYWREPDNAYLVMRWLRGGSLKRLLATGVLPVEVTLSIVEQIAAALHVAHRQQIIHRDIKTANILLDEDKNAYLSDFSVAKDLSVTNGDGIGFIGVKGSPEYISPELILHEAVTPLSDQYSLGIVAYEMLMGEGPFPDESPAVLLHCHLKEPIPPVASRRSVPPAVDEVIQRATAKRAADRFPDILAFANAFREAMGGLRPVVAVVRTPVSGLLVSEGEIANPYKGLQAFQETDVDDFFGREALVERLIARLHETTAVDENESRFLGIVGPSGSGKSSVVKAGLLPALREGAVAGSEKWFMVEMAPGTHPLEELETALLRVAINPPADLLEPLQKDERGLTRVLKRVLPSSSGEALPQLLLVVDQFEELFTLVEDETARQHFLRSLLTALAEPRSRLRLIITLRADFYDRPLQLPELGELLRKRTEVVLPLTPGELERSITHPAAKVGVGLEAGLLAEMTADVADQPGALPLMQYALTELFERRLNHRMTLAAYREIGGVSGALGRRADDLYESLDAAGQEATRQLFLRLVTLGEGTEDTRQRVLRAELMALDVAGEQRSRGAEENGEISQSPNLPILGTKSQDEVFNLQSPILHVIDLFGRYRLLTFDRDPVTRGPTAEVAHEALLREWGRLRSWLYESRAELRLGRLLTQAAAEWEATGHDDGFLLRGARLNQLAPLATGAIALTEGERQYLDASLAARHAREAAEEARRQSELAQAQKLAETERQRAEEQGRAALRLRQRAALLAGALALALILATAAVLFSRQAGQNAALAQSNANVAQTAEAQAIDQQATAEAERIRAEAGQMAALAAEATAAAEADIRATAEAVAIQEQQTAEQQTLLATSRELAAAALNNLSVDPELSLLLALQALSTAHIYEAENALHRALPNLHLLRTLPAIGVGDMKLSPDGRYLAVGGNDGLQIWDIPAALAGAPDPLFLTLAQDIYEIVYSVDGARIATFGADGIVRVLDASTGEVLSTLPGYSPELQNLNFSPDNTRLAIADLDGNLTVWDIQSGREEFTISGHTDVEAVNTPISGGNILQVKFSPDGLRLATAGTDRTARIWNADTGQEITTLTGHVNEVNNLMFSVDGQRLATAGSDGTAKIWDISQDSPEGRLLLNLSHNEGVYGLGFSLDGKLLATGERGGGLLVWDTLSGRKLLDLVGHESTVRGTLFTPDGAHLITNSADESIKIWDVTHGRELFSLVGPGGPVGGPVFSPDGLYLATGHTDGNVMIWERVSGQLLFTLPAHDAFIVDLAFNSDGTRLATASWDGTAKVWDTAVIAAGDIPEPVIMTGHTDRLWRVDFSPDGSRLATGSVDETAKIWDVESGELLATITGHMGNGSRIAALEISPDGTRLATGAGDRSVKVWDLTTTETIIDQPILAMPHDTAFINDVAFSPNGSLLAVGNEEGPVIVWDISGTEGRMLHELVGHTGSTIAVDFSPDGSQLVTASFDGSVKVWDMTRDGQELLTLSAHTDSAIGVAFSPDGKQVASASFDGTAQVYVLDTNELIALAHERLTRWFTTDECNRYLHVAICPERDQ